MTLGRVTDCNAAAALIRDSWKQHPGGALEYSPEFLQACLAQPSQRPALAPAYFDADSHMVAMVFGMPRTVRLQQRNLNLVLMTFFTVASDWKGRGIGKKLWPECLRQAVAAGYDGCLHYCAEGNHSNHVTVAATRDAGFSAVHVFDVNFLMRLNRRTGECGGTDSVTSPVDFLSAGEMANADLIRSWTAEQAAWHLSRPGVVAVSIRSSSGPAALVGYCAPVLDSPNTRCVTVEDVLWDCVSLDERRQLLHDFIGVADRAGTDLITVPVLNYTDLGAFTAMGFRKTRRLVHAYLTTWVAAAPSSLSSAYIDVI